MSRPFYYEYAWAYNLMVNPEIEKQVNFLKQAVKEYSHNNLIEILDAGCGPGGLSLAMASEGFKVTGIDLSEAMINEAKNQKPGSTNPCFKVGNILQSNYSNHFDVIICRGVLNDITKEEDRRKIFSLFYTALKKNGVFIADVREWEATLKRKTLDPIYEKTLNTKEGTLTFRSETWANISEKKIDISEWHQLRDNGNIIFSHYFFTMKCWTLPEIIRYSIDQNFSIENIFSDYNIKSKIGESDRIVFVLKKT